MSTIKITNLTSSGAIIGNVVLPVVGNVAGTLTTLKATVDQLKTFVTAGAEANITLANTIQSQQINAANIGIIGFIGLGNSTTRSYIDGQISAANAGVTASVTAANLGIIGYIDSIANQSIYSNVNVKAYTETMGFQNFSNVNVAAYVTTANSAVVGYIDFANTIQSQQLSAANIGIIGFIGLGNSTTRAYIDGQISAANAGVTAANVGMLGLVNAFIDAVTVANSIQANLLANLGAIDLTTINAALGVHTGQISALDANAAVQAGNIAELFANAAAQAVLISSLGNTQQIEANITTLQSNAATQSDLIIGITANVTAANIGIKGYVDSRITLANTGITTANTGMLGYVDSRITVANAGVTAANVGIIGYINLSNTIQSAQITAANLGIIGYINLSNTIQSAQIDTLTSNAATQGANINTLLSSVGTLTGQLSEANLGLKGYVDLANTIQSAQIGAANLAITAANIGMKGYVDNQTYSNVQVATFLPTYSGNISAGNISVAGTSGLIGYSSGGFVQQITSNVTQVASHTTSGNIQLMSIQLDAQAGHIVPFASNKLSTNDLLIVKHLSGSLTSIYVDAYVTGSGTADIWMRNISSSPTGAFTPMLKYVIIRAPSA